MNSDQNKLYGSSEEIFDVIDRDVVKALIELGADDDPDLLLDLIDLFLDDGDRRIQLLADAIAGRDLDSVARAAHTLRSASANLGAVEFADLCRVVETHARLGEAEPAFHRAHQSVEQFTTVRDALVRLRSEFDSNNH